MRRWIGLCLALLTLLALAVSARGQSQPFQTADELLDAIETADGAIERLSADILYTRDFALAGDRQIRSGSLGFISDDDGRRFAIVFETLIVGERLEPDGRTFVFDGQWLTERIPAQQLMLRRQVAPPGADFDPLRVGEGPLPLPLGQKKADILARYDAIVPPPTSGLAGRDDEAQLTGFVTDAGAAQLRLVPKPAFMEEDPFDEIRLWYVPTGTGVLPLMAMTLNKTGDEVVVRLINVKLNADAKIDGDAFDDTPPPGWEIDVTPYRSGTGPPTPSTPVFARLQPEADPRVQDLEPVEAAADRFDPPPSVRALLDAPFTTPAEAARLRVFHGQWTADDLSDPLLAAETALIRGVPDHPAIDNADLPASLRAEAALARGEAETALKLLEGDASYRAVRLRVEALETLARYDEALAATEVAVDRLRRERSDSAADLTDGVLTLIARARLAGPERADGSDFQTLMALLTRARGELDRLYWPAILAEAELLYDKDERGRAGEALQEVLRLNPAAADAWMLLGRLAVDSFDFDRAEAVAARLDALAERDTPWWIGEGGAVPDAATRSIAGSLVLARARVRQDDPRSGLERIAQLLGRFATHRGLLAAQAALHACNYDDASLADTLAALDALSPGTDLGHLAAGWAFSERRQYTRSAEMLEEAMRRQPNRPESAILLGLLELQSGRDLNALAALRRVAELDPFNARAANSLELLEELVTYDTIETEHFRIRFRPGVDEIMAREMPPILERIHQRVSGTDDGGIDHEPSIKTTVELMPTHAWFAVRIAGMPQLHTIAAATGPVIAMEVPRIGPEHKVGVYDWARVFQHEYVHTVTLSRTRNRLPHWFTEAAAQYLEDAPRDERTCRLLAAKLDAGELFDMDEINLRFTRPRTPEDRSLAYAQGHWMYEYLVETFGDDAPRQLMDAYARGEREDTAMPSILGIDRETFLARFTAWAEDQAAAWGVLAGPDRPNLEHLARLAGITGQPTEDDLLSMLGDHPGHPQVIEALALATGKERGELTQTQVERLLAWAEAVPVAETPHRRLARHFLALGPESADAALRHLEFLDARAQYTPAYAAALATRYAERGEHTPALVKAERATIIAPFDADQRELAARIALLTRDFEAAERHLDALTLLEPDRPEHTARLERFRELMKR
ncbi:MAG: hypothetical protein AAGB48_08610 [Planctomycetota bacterium]